MRRPSAFLFSFSVVSASVAFVLLTGCAYGQCYDSSYDAISDVAPDDLDCKPGDIAIGSGDRGRWAEGCSRVAEYSCSSGRRSACWRCELIRVQQY